jgi:hypothetical protein
MLNVDGLVLESKYPQLQFVIKGPMLEDWRDGHPVRRPKHIVIDFDRYLCELDVLSREQEWTDEDKVYVGKGIEAQFNNPTFRDFWIHEAPKVPPPWPTYNETHHNQIPVIAQSIGLVAEALRYEQLGREGGPRASVVEKLTAIAGEQPQEETTTAFVPDEDDLAAV